MSIRLFGVSAFLAALVVGTTIGGIAAQAACWAECNVHTAEGWWYMVEEESHSWYFQFDQEVAWDPTDSPYTLGGNVGSPADVNLQVCSSGSYICYPAESVHSELGYTGGCGAPIPFDDMDTACDYES